MTQAVFTLDLDNDEPNVQPPADTAEYISRRKPPAHMYRVGEAVSRRITKGKEKGPSWRILSFSAYSALAGASSHSTPTGAYLRRASGIAIEVAAGAGISTVKRNRSAE